MSQHRLAYCSFTCPDSWELVAPSTWAAPGKGLARLHARLFEQWLPAARPVAEVAAEVKMLWAAADAGATVEHEAALTPPGGGEGWGAVVRMRDEFGQPARRLASLAVLGPVACQLTVDRPLELPESLDLDANQVASSFRLEATEVLAPARNVPVAPVDPAVAPLPLGAPVPVPTLCLGLAVPRGWELTTSAPCRASLAGTGMTIAVHRRLGTSGDLRAWLGERLTELAGVPDATLQAWESGMLARPAFVGIASREPESGGKWVKPRFNDVVVRALRDRQLIEWRLTATAAPLAQALAALRQVESASAWLPPADWETPVVEPWLPLTLRGGWTSEGDGVYVKVDGGMLLLHLAIGTSAAPLEKARPTMGDIIDTVRGRAALLDVFQEEEAVGSWRGLEAYRYALDAEFVGLGKRSARGVVCKSGDKLYSCRLIGAEKDQAHSVFLEILEKIRVPGMKEK